MTTRTETTAKTRNARLKALLLAGVMVPAMVLTPMQPSFAQAPDQERGPRGGGMRGEGGGPGGGMRGPGGGGMREGGGPRGDGGGPGGGTRGAGGGMRGEGGPRGGEGGPREGGGMRGPRGEGGMRAEPGERRAPPAGGPGADRPARAERPEPGAGSDAGARENKRQQREERAQQRRERRNEDREGQAAHPRDDAGSRGAREPGPGERGPGERGPGERRMGGPADKGQGGREPGERGPGERRMDGPGDRMPGDRGLGDRGPRDRGPGDRGPGDRGPGDRGPAGGPDERRMGGPGDRDRGPADRGPGDRGPGDRGPGDRGPGDRRLGNERDRDLRDDRRRGGLSPAGAAAIGAAAGFAGGFIAGNGARRLDEIRRDRREVREGDRVYIREPGRTIVEDGNRRFVVHDPNDRFRELGYRVNRERRGGDFVDTIVLPGGDAVLNFTTPDGRLLRRVRRGRDGREVVLFENVVRPIQEDVVVLPPPPMRIPRDRYVVDYGAAGAGAIYETLVAPPVAPPPQRYSLDQVLYSPTVRNYVRSVDINTINFDTGSWVVPGDQTQKLVALADAINKAIDQDRNSVFLIEGYTDSTGNPNDNLSLSDRRAQSVAAILTKSFNVPPENLTTQGYGDQNPKEDTSGPSAANRRVVVRNITQLLASGGAVPQ